MVARQLPFQIFIYLTVNFQIVIFIHRDIYCSQASRRYSWSVHCKNQDKSAGSCETVRTGLWGVRTPRSVLQIKIEDVRKFEQHRPDARSISIQEGVCFQKSTLFGKSLQSVRTTRQHVRMMFSICRPSGRLGNTSGRYPVVQINSRFPFERGKDFSEDCPDANLIRIELCYFWRIPQKFLRTRLSSVWTLDR
jgi:hypothetical protein